jgi:nitroimidazol reductase NimA-like FMN-containing flavoprotein (pyridoxamine 5'-phosphate oxidase superfamily)
MVTAQVPGPRTGDLARRLIARQAELGLSVETVAERAGMSPTYLKYFEQSADVDMSRGTWIRLARVLDLTEESLAGGTIERPSGLGRAGPHPSLETLSPEECEMHLRSGGVGRVVFVAERGPSAFPVNFEFVNGVVFFRTHASTATEIASGGLVGFEVDRIDDAMSEGWSVLVTGTAQVVTALTATKQLQTLDIEPWAGGERPTFFRIEPGQISGRAIHQRTDTKS